MHLGERNMMLLFQCGKREGIGRGKIAAAQKERVRQVLLLTNPYAALVLNASGAFFNACHVTQSTRKLSSYRLKAITVILF